MYVASSISFPSYTLSFHCKCFATSSSQGFDEFMNLVMDEAQEVYQKSENRRQIGMYFLSANMRSIVDCGGLCCSLVCLEEEEELGGGRREGGG